MYCIGAGTSYKEEEYSTGIVPTTVEAGFEIDGTKSDVIDESSSTVRLLLFEKSYDTGTSCDTF